MQVSDGVYIVTGPLWLPQQDARGSGKWEMRHPMIGECGTASCCCSGCLNCRVSHAAYSTALLAAMRRQLIETHSSMQKAVRMCNALLSATPYVCCGCCSHTLHYKAVLNLLLQQ